jgi:hypothetical protein
MLALFYYGQQRLMMCRDNSCPCGRGPRRRGRDAATSSMRSFEVAAKGSVSNSRAIYQTGNNNNSTNNGHHTAATSSAAGNGNNDNGASGASLAGVSLAVTTSSTELIQVTQPAIATTVTIHVQP